MLNKFLVSILSGCALALPCAGEGPTITFPTDVGCGEVNVFYTGLAAYHPLVAAQGYDLDQVDISLRNDTANLVRAGFNVYVLFQGPDQPVTNLGDRMKGRHWDVNAVGFGIRGSILPEVVTLFEDNLHEFRESAPLTPTVFNWSPTSLAQSVIRRVPLNEDCTDRPGTLYGYEEICSPDLCESVTVITSGSLDELLEGIPQ